MFQNFLKSVASEFLAKMRRFRHNFSKMGRILEKNDNILLEMQINS